MRKTEQKLTQFQTAVLKEIKAGFASGMSTSGAQKRAAVQLEAKGLVVYEPSFLVDVSGNFRLTADGAVWLLKNE